MLDITNKSIAVIASALRRRDFSAEELARHFLGAIAGRNGELNAYLDVYEHAGEQAKAADKILAEDKNPPILTGVPLALKDNILAAAKAGANDYLVKPFSGEAMKTKIVKLFQN